ncbi:RiPP maturation radical SAM protein 1, partial [Rhizobium ruizarguesonis]
QKPAAQAPEEMIDMSARYGTSRIEAVDNILAYDYVEKALPRLIALPKKLNIFFEVKANLKRREVEKLAAGGIRWIQPGVESLDSRV